MLRETQSGRIVVAVVTGASREQVEVEIEEYEKDYNPAGYGTFLFFGPVETRPGYWEAKLERLVCCD
jgi:hypothetical protein